MNEIMCKIIHKYEPVFLFFLLTNKHNFSSNAREEKTEMGPVSRGEDFYPSA